MNSRERVLSSLNFRSIDRIPKDLGSHRSTGISCFAYPDLVSKLGLAERLPRIFDLGQMLALVEIDVLDALNCDVVIVDIQKGGPYLTNCFFDDHQWEFFDFNGRIKGLVPKGRYSFSVKDDGSIEELHSSLRMPVDSYVFDLLSGGQPLSFMDDIPKLDLAEYKEQAEHSYLITEEESNQMAGFIKKVRNSTDRAVHLSRGPFTSLLWPGGHAGMGIFPIICMQEPDYVHRYHEILTNIFLENMRKLLPKIQNDIDIIDLGHGDWGTQNSLIMSPDLYRELFKPYYKALNAEAAKIAPDIKRLVHSCGAIYPILDIMIDEVGIQAVNPVQWYAGNSGYKAWKDKVRHRMSLWGGAVNSQHTLPLGSVEQIKDELKEVVEYLSADGGYVFNNVHNILAEIPAEKIIAMYQSADEI